MEKPFYFQNGSHDLFGVLHAPEITTPRGCLVLCHPFGEEKLWSHRVFVNLAREATSRGYAVLRFDFMGHGDSSGQSEDCSINTYLSDLEAAVAEARNHFPNSAFFGLVGLRFGATLAYLFAEKHDDIGPLVLWEPIIDGGRYMQELLRINLSTQLATFGKLLEDRSQLIENMDAGRHANVGGYLMSAKFYRECSEVHLGTGGNCLSHADCLVVQVAPDSKQKDRADLVSVADRYASADFLKIREHVFWREVRPFSSKTSNLIQNTLLWLEK